MSASRMSLTHTVGKARSSSKRKISRLVRRNTSPHFDDDLFVMAQNDGLEYRSRDEESTRRIRSRGRGSEFN